MANKIIIKKSSVASKVPVAGDLDVAELAVNLADAKLYTKNASGTVIQLGGGSGSGDVVGPSSATDNALARFDGTTGKLIQNGTVTQDDNGSLANVNAITFDTTPTSPPTTAGSVYWDSGNQTPSIVINANTELQLGQENIALVYNGTGSTIPKGSVVAVTGAQGQRPSVVLADADSEALSAPTLGITAEAIANGAEGFVCTFGLVRGLNTSAFTAGAPIYLSQTAGAFTATRPSAPAHTVFLGWVISINASSGEVFVNINNGWELDELHNVLITSPASGNTLIYDATAGVWKNANLTAGTGISVTNGAGSISIANTGVTSVTGTSPIVSSGGATPAISMPAATTSVNGYLTSTDWNTFNGKQAALVSGTNIKTVNGTTLLGSGNLAVGTVTSVAASAGTGISVSGSPITGSGTITITNTAPDQTVALTGGGATTISGTYPNFTITSVNTTYAQATSTTLGLIELGSDTVQTVAPNAVTATASRSYALQLNSAGQAMVNVPWTDTNSGGTVTSITAGTGLSGGTITTSGTVALANTSVTAGSYTSANITVDAQGRLTAASNGGSGSTYDVEYLVVAGGGGGGRQAGGGGGGGGFVDGLTYLASGTGYTVTVGGGGAGQTSATLPNQCTGSDSRFGNIYAAGGGGGAGYRGNSGYYKGAPGGSGGGGWSFAASTNSSPWGMAIGGQGTSGSPGAPGGSYQESGGGGGGAGGAPAYYVNNTFAGNGGNGRVWLNGTTYAGGGGSGGSNLSGSRGNGGTGGGGNGGEGAYTTATVGSAGSTNTGGGGGGGGGSTAALDGGNGGSGIVIIRYPGAQRGTGGTYSSSGGYSFHTFTSSGTYTA